MRFTRPLTALALGVGLASPAVAEAADNLVTVLTSENAQTQLMALVLTTQAVEQGAEARILLCGPGGDLALIDPPESATAEQPPQGASPQGILRALIERGVAVDVCAIYLPGLGAEPDVLVEGVGVAQPPEMAAEMMGQGVQVWFF